MADRSGRAKKGQENDALYRRHRFPPGVIAHAVWLYFRFPLSLWMVEHRVHEGLKNRAENSHQLFRRGERIGKRFKSPRQVQRIVSINDPIADLFHLPCHEMNSASCETKPWQHGAISHRSVPP